MNADDVTDPETKSPDVPSPGKRDDVPIEQSNDRTTIKDTSDQIEVAFTDFREAFERDPRNAMTQLLDLLLEPAACQLRSAFLQEVGKTSAGREWAPAGNLSRVQDYVVELNLLATGQLGKAVLEQKVDIEHLVQLTSHPVALLAASRVLLKGESELAKIMTEQP